MIQSGLSLSKNILADKSGAMLKPHLGGNGSGSGPSIWGMTLAWSQVGVLEMRTRGRIQVLFWKLGWLLVDALRVLLHVILQSLIVGIWEVFFSSEFGIYWMSQTENILTTKISTRETMQVWCYASQSVGVGMWVCRHLLIQHCPYVRGKKVGRKVSMF